MKLRERVARWVEDELGIDMGVDRPELGPRHQYAQRATLADVHYGDRCVWCLEPDREKRPYTDKRCTREVRGHVAGQA